MYFSLSLSLCRRPRLDDFACNLCQHHTTHISVEWCTQDSRYCPPHTRSSWHPRQRHHATHDAIIIYGCVPVAPHLNTRSIYYLIYTNNNIRIDRACARITSSAHHHTRRALCVAGQLEGSRNKLALRALCTGTAHFIYVQYERNSIHPQIGWIMQKSLSWLKRDCTRPGQISRSSYRVDDNYVHMVSLPIYHAHRHTQNT